MTDMITSQTEIKTVEVGSVIPAVWNYKQPFEENEYKQRFLKSIEKDASVGVLAVRELEDGQYEAIDGNHRLLGIQELGWTHVPIENFGKLSQAEAVLLARRRNFNWFKDDVVKFAELLTQATEEISIEDMAEYMPDPVADLEKYSELLNFDWAQFDKATPPKTESEDAEVILNIAPIPENIESTPITKQWAEWIKRVASLIEFDDKNTPLQILLAISATVTDEQILELSPKDSTNDA